MKSFTIRKRLLKAGERVRLVGAPAHLKGPGTVIEGQESPFDGVTVQLDHMPPHRVGVACGPMDVVRAR